MLSREEKEKLLCEMNIEDFAEILYKISEEKAKLLCEISVEDFAETLCKISDEKFYSIMEKMYIHAHKEPPKTTTMLCNWISETIEDCKVKVDVEKKQKKWFDTSLNNKNIKY